MTSVIERALATIHLLSAAAWFGALGYRLFFVEPKARKFLGDTADYERFSLTLADGMRPVVLAALLTCGLSGFALVGLRWNLSDAWLTLIAGKVVLWIIALGVFAYVSWVYWPRRVFATAGEWAGVRRQGFLISLAMIAVAGLGIVLGQLSQAVRSPVEVAIWK
jgi:putative copper export protein